MASALGTLAGGTNRMATAADIDQNAPITTPLPVLFLWPAFSPVRRASISRYNLDVVVRKIHR
jgi:hypothetical protein